MSVTSDHRKQPTAHISRPCVDWTNHQKLIKQNIYLFRKCLKTVLTSSHKRIDEKYKIYFLLLLHLDILCNISKIFSWMLYGYGHPKWFIFSYYYSVDKKNVYKSVLARLRISIIWTGTKNKCDCQWSLSLLNGQQPFPFPENTGNTI